MLLSLSIKYQFAFWFGPFAFRLHFPNAFLFLVPANFQWSLKKSSHFSFSILFVPSIQAFKSCLWWPVNVILAYNAYINSFYSFFFKNIFLIFFFNFFIRLLSFIIRFDSFTIVHSCAMLIFQTDSVSALPQSLCKYVAIFTMNTKTKTKTEPRHLNSVQYIY